MKTTIPIILLMFFLIGVTSTKSIAYMLDIKDGSISLKAKNEPLLPLLKEIGNKLGITILVPRDFKQDVGLEINSFSIEDGINRLLGKSNVIQMWDGKRLRKIAILNSGKPVNNPRVLTMGRDSGRTRGQRTLTDTIGGKPVKHMDIRRSIDELSSLSKQSLPPLNMPGVEQYIQGQLQKNRVIEEEFKKIIDKESMAIQNNIESITAVINLTGQGKSKKQQYEKYVSLVEMKNRLKLEKQQKLSRLLNTRDFLRSSLISAKRLKN